jgi:uncharacterized surface protein with fasciclin (FAS1) repeats
MTNLPLSPTSWRRPKPHDPLDRCQGSRLVETLKGKGPFTVFAPTDDAFKALGEDTIKSVLADKDLLKKILLAHVIVGQEARAADVLKLNGKEVNGFKIDTSDGVKIGEAKVIKADLLAGNGVVHVIDKVLLPK